jgi:uncharacterized protein (DUF362 family)
MKRPVVVIGSLETLHNQLIEQMSESIKLLGLDEDFDKAQAIFIKPNLTYPNFKQGVTTRVEFVEALICALRQINDDTRIYIGEGEGGYNSFSMTAALRTMGFHQLEQSYPNVHVINLSGQPTIEVALEARGNPYLVKLPELFFKDIDFSITCPLPKVHCMTNITLSLKNQWGCLPDAMRLKNHYVFDEIIGQVCEKLKFRYAFLDGKYGLDNNGPMVGNPVEVNWFVASNSLGAFDVVVSKMMGTDWRKVKHLMAAAQRGLVPKEEAIEIIGDIDSLKRQFRLKRTFWNYPALVAFYSSRLTHLVYFSRWAKVIHDIMYTFRKRPIEE